MNHNYLPLVLILTLALTSFLEGSGTLEPPTRPGEEKVEWRELRSPKNQSILENLEKVNRDTFGNQGIIVVLHGDSMLPTIETPTYKLVIPTLFRDVEVGDIIRFSYPESYGRDYNVIHRVIKEVPGGFIAQGDNNGVPDDFVITEELYKGRVYVPTK